MTPTSTLWTIFFGVEREEVGIGMEREDAEREKTAGFGSSCR